METLAHRKWIHKCGNENQINAELIMNFKGDCEDIYNFPIIYKDKSPLLSQDEFVPIAGRTSLFNDKAVHGYVDDYRLNSWWKRLDYYTKKMTQCKVVITPDFSIYHDMPLYLQLYQIARSRFTGAYMQQMGIPVIPSLTWTDEKSYDYAFLSIQKGCDVSTSTHIGSDRGDNYYRDEFLYHLKNAIQILQPNKLWIYNIRFVQEIKALHPNVQFIISHSQKIRQYGKV